MSKNITVSEGNTARVFGNTKKIETRLQGEDAGSCFWVPEDETEAQPLYITENGMHEASEAGVYGFSEVHVNIPKKTTDDDGVDWDVHIDDEGVPHITIDDPDSPYTGTDITIDPETGDIDVHIPGNDPDDWPEWDDLDPDIKTDFDDWIDEPKFPGDWPGLDDLEPEIVGEFENWIDDGNDPDLWPGWDDLDPDEKTDFDDWMDDPKDPDDWPGWEDIDPEIKTDFDEWTADTDTEIDPEDAGLDPDRDVDVSFDPDEQDVDMTGTDNDWNDAAVDYDPATGEYENKPVPFRITVTVLPQKIDYKPGETINYSGLVVHAYDKNGQDLGEIPFSQLILPIKKVDDGFKKWWTDSQGLNVMQIGITPQWNQTLWVNTGTIQEQHVFCGPSLGSVNGRPATLGGGDTPAAVYLTRYNGYLYAVALTGNPRKSICGYFTNELSSSGQTRRKGWFVDIAVGGTIPKGNFGLILQDYGFTSVPESGRDPNGIDPSALKATGVSIPVLWKWSGIKEPLETAFNIYVKY